MTEKLFQDDPQLRSTAAMVQASAPEGIVLDRTVFYARGGGQPGDTGVLRWDGGETPIADTVKGDGESILHLPAPGAALPPLVPFCAARANGMAADARRPTAATRSQSPAVEAS